MIIIITINPTNHLDQLHITSVFDNWENKNDVGDYRSQPICKYPSVYLSDIVVLRGCSNHPGNSPGVVPSHIMRHQQEPQTASSPSSVSQNLSSAGLERANWPRGKLERGCLLPSFPSAFARFAWFPRSRDHPEGLLTVYKYLEQCQLLKTRTNINGQSRCHF